MCRLHTPVLVYMDSRLQIRWFSYIFIVSLVRQYFFLSGVGVDVNDFLTFFEAHKRTSVPFSRQGNQEAAGSGWWASIIWIQLTDDLEWSDEVFKPILRPSRFWSDQWLAKAGCRYKLIEVSRSQELPEQEILYGTVHLWFMIFQSYVSCVCLPISLFLLLWFPCFQWGKVGTSSCMIWACPSGTTRADSWESLSFECWRTQWHIDLASNPSQVWLRFLLHIISRRFHQVFALRRRFTVSPWGILETTCGASFLRLAQEQEYLISGAFWIR